MGNSDSNNLTDPEDAPYLVLNICSLKEGR